MLALAHEAARQGFPVCFIAEHNLSNMELARLRAIPLPVEVHMGPAGLDPVEALWGPAGHDAAAAE